MRDPAFQKLSNRKQAAALGVSRNTLNRIAKEHGLPHGHVREPGIVGDRVATLKAEAEAEGLDYAEVRKFAEEIIREDREHVCQRHELLRACRRMAVAYGIQLPTGSSPSAGRARNLDEIAADMATRFPGQFIDCEDPESRLLEILEAGPLKRKTTEEAYKAAIEYSNPLTW